MNWKDRARRLLGRAKPSFDTPPPPEDSPEDWQVGDMAECIGCGSAWFSTDGMILLGGPQPGEVRMVAKVSTDSGPQALHFERYGMSYAFAASYFRKITPKADEAVRAEPAWVADLIGAPQPEKVG